MGLTRGDLFNVNLPLLGGGSPKGIGSPVIDSPPGAAAPGAAALGAMPLPVLGEGHVPGTGKAMPVSGTCTESSELRLPRGVRFVPQSTAGVVDTYVGSPAGGGAESYQLDPDYRHHPQADTDVSALAEGYITVTPLHIDMTNHDRLAALAGLKWQPPT